MSNKRSDSSGSDSSSSPKFPYKRIHEDVASGFRPDSPIMRKLRKDKSLDHLLHLYWKNMHTKYLIYL